MKKNCLICEKEFTPWKKTGKFCSRLCTGKANGSRNFGKKRDPEIGRKISLKRKGMVFSEEHRKNLSRSFRGRVSSMKGKKHTKEAKKKNADAHRGDKSSFWKGGATQLDRLIRKTFQYRDWRTAVYTRDKYSCCWCGATRAYLQAHHLKQFAVILKENEIKSVEQAIGCDELWMISNGITLCLECHKKTDTYFNKGSKNV